MKMFVMDQVSYEEGADIPSDDDFAIWADKNLNEFIKKKELNESSVEGFS